MRKDKPSKTARKVALNIVTLGAQPGMDTILPPGLAESTARLLVESGVVGATGAKWSRSRKMGYVYRAFDWIMPGQFEAFGHRKAFCEHQVREGIAAGASQVLILGPGYDTIGWRLAPEFSGVNFFKIDHPATARLKVKGIEVMGQRPNLYLIAEDLGERQLVAVLAATSAWDPTASTVIIAEGLLMYLPPEAVGDLFAQCAAISGSNSRIAFSYVGTRSDGRPDAGPMAWLALLILRVSGEPWLWSMPPEDFDLFLKEKGWKIAPDLGPSDQYGVEFFGVGSR